MWVVWVERSRGGEWGERCAMRREVKGGMERVLG